MSSTPSMDEPRVSPSRGNNGGNDSICGRTSGEQFSRNHVTPAPLTATLDCVRGLARAGSVRASRQQAQLQFHCGNPPPAAVPRRRMRIDQCCVFRGMMIQRVPLYAVHSPFTRMIHIWSGVGTLAYLFRPYQIVRTPQTRAKEPIRS